MPPGGTVGSTIGFTVFTGLFIGLASGALYLLIRRWLPAGRLAGVAFGGVLLVIAAIRIERLRRDNPDFDIVRPGWLSLVVVRRAGRGPWHVGRRRGRSLQPGPALAVAPWPVGPRSRPAVARGPLGARARARDPRRRRQRPRRPASIRGRDYAVPALHDGWAGPSSSAILLAAIPGFVTSVADILGRGPWRLTPARRWEHGPDRDAGGIQC